MNRLRHRAAHRTAVTLVAATVVVAACGADGAGGYGELDDATDASGGVAIEAWSDESFEATGMRFLPDGRALVITKGGWQGPSTAEVVLLDRDGTTIGPVLELPVCSDAERGLLGVEVSPHFDDDHAVYLFYTRQMAGCAVSEIGVMPPEPAHVYNRLSRFVFDEAAMQLVDEQVLVDELPGHQSTHNAGDLLFLPDESLLVATGEARLGRSEDRSVLDGKILRLDVANPTVPLADNPFAASGGVTGLIYATGLRNPFRLAATPDGTTIVAADVGTDEFEELNIVRAGEFYGFPRVEGPGTPNGATTPIYSYDHDEGCEAIIGGDFVSDGAVPGVDGPTFLFHDMVCGGIWAIGLGDDPSGPVSLGSVPYALSDLVVGPDGAVYLVPITLEQIRRLTLDG
jgi:glucose/arabinose dehydrogenase